MKIRREEKKDYHEVETVIREAFWDVYRPRCFEHYVVHLMRDDSCFVPELDYVATDDEGKIIGSIVYAKASIDTDTGEKKQILIFGPVGVLPEYQEQGYGKALIDHTMKLARDMGYPAIAITGNPFYYCQYGFESASKYGIYYKGLPKDEESPFFMICVFDENKVKELKGVYSDPDCYYTEDAKVIEYDKLWPEKESHYNGDAK